VLKRRQCPIIPAFMITKEITLKTTGIYFEGAVSSHGQL
jgi:hypothetical protein